MTEEGQRLLERKAARAVLFEARQHFSRTVTNFYVVPTQERKQAVLDAADAVQLAYQRVHKEN